MWLMTSVCVASSNVLPFTSNISSPTSRLSLSAGEPIMLKLKSHYVFTINLFSMWKYLKVNDCYRTTFCQIKVILILM